MRNKFKLDIKQYYLIVRKKCVEKNTKSKNPEVVKIKNAELKLLSRCAACNSKQSKSIKEQEARRLLNIFFQKYKMNDITNNFLLGRDKSMSRMNLRQSGPTYSDCQLFNKNKEVKGN